MVMQDEISLNVVSMVRPSTPTGRQFMFLSSCDLKCRPYPYINRIFFYKTKDNCSFIIDSLKSSLSKVLVYFFPLAGRFTKNEDGRLEIDCDDSGVEFVEGSTAVPFSKLEADNFQYRPLFWNLARRTELFRSDYLDRPILSIQVTRFDGGGLSIGVSLSHTATDAQSFYDFVRCWGDVCRGAALSMVPLHIRSDLKPETLFPDEDVFRMKKLNGDVEKGQHADSTKELLQNGNVEKEQHADSTKELLQNGNVEKEQHAHSTKELPQNGSRDAGKHASGKEEVVEESKVAARPVLVQKVFSFSQQALRRLKETANELGEGGVTTFEAFSAHWWAALLRAGELEDDQMAYLLVPMNCRKRFLSLPPAYFGNCLSGARCVGRAGELRRASLGELAVKIHQSIADVSEDFFVKSIKEAEKMKNAIPHFDRRGVFHIVDSPLFDVYECDFGWGRPSCVRAEGFRFGAEVQILQGVHGHGSVDLFVALPPHHMSRLEHDPDFLSC